MKKLRIIGNVIFFSLVVYFIGQSVNVFLGKKAMQASLVNTSNEIKELENRKSKLLDQEKNSDENEKNEKYASLKAWYSELCFTQHGIELSNRYVKVKKKILSHWEALEWLSL